MKLTTVIALAIGYMSLLTLPALAADYTGYVTDTKCFVGLGLALLHI